MAPSVRTPERAQVLESLTLAEYLRLRRAKAAADAAEGKPARQPQVVLLRNDESVAIALARLNHMRILSAPLVQVHLDGVHYDTLAFLSVGDLARSFVERSTMEAPPGQPVLVRLAALAKAGGLFARTQLMHVRSAQDGTAIWQTETTSLTLGDAVRKCFFYGEPPAQGWPVNHRFAVHDASRRVSDVVSQSDIASYVVNNLAQLGPLADRTLRSLGLGQEPPVLLPAATPIMDCFATLARECVPAAAVVDDASGCLLANLSDSDLRYLSPDSFGAFALPVGEYLLHAYGVNPRMPQPGTFNYNPSSTPFGVALSAAAPALTVTANLECTLGSTLQQLCGNAVHRVWVVDDARRPTGVVSLSDVLAVLAGVTPIPLAQALAPAE